MSEPSRTELEHEGWQLAKERCFQYYGREPSEDEIQDEYEFLCEKFGGE